MYHSILLTSSIHGGQQENNGERQSHQIVSHGRGCEGGQQTVKGSGHHVVHAHVERAPVAGGQVEQQVAGQAHVALQFRDLRLQFRIDLVEAEHFVVFPGQAPKTKKHEKGLTKQTAAGGWAI